MIKKKIIGFLFGVFSLSLISSASATELKLATFEPPKAFIASKILGAWAEKVNKCANGKLNVKMCIKCKKRIKCKKSTKK